MAYVCSTATRAARFVSRLSFVLATMCGAATVASAQTTVTLSTPGTHINADLTIQGGGYSSVDFSSSHALESKVSGNESYTRRILVKIDTQNYIPANAVIQSAKLYLVLAKAESSENRPFAAYHVTKSFVTRQATWRNFRDGQAWSTGGGDLGTRFGTTYVGNSVGSTYTFDLTQQVQRAVNGDFGSRYTRLALIDTGGASDGNYRAFHSTRASNSALRPRLVVTYGSSSTTSSSSSTTSSSPSTTTSSSGTTLRVMQWNIKKTKGSDGVCNPDRIAGVVVKHGVHVVSMNEVNQFSGECAWSFDMSVKLQSLLQQKTGVTWYRQFVNADGKIGNVLLSRFKPSSSGTKLLSYQRGVAQVTIVVNGRNVNLFTTHVDYYNASYRTAQTKELVTWARNFSEPRIILGDFNTNPGTSDYSLMATPYQDAWAAAKKAGTAWAFNSSGATHGASRFDYVYHSRVSSLSLVKVTVPDTRVNGVWPSDHHPVVVEYRVN